jgi:hypothetical protein
MRGFAHEADCLTLRLEIAENGRQAIVLPGTGWLERGHEQRSSIGIDAFLARAGWAGAQSSLCRAMPRSAAISAWAGRWQRAC